MAVDRHLWTKEFDLAYRPSWTCPLCSKGRLALFKENIKEFETTQSKYDYQQDYWDPSFYKAHFCATMKCDNLICGETVVVSGTVKWEDLPFGDPNFPEFGTEVFYCPKYIIPFLHIFPLLKTYPEEINSLIKEAFELYWVNNFSCANMIRAILEKVLEEQKITKGTLFERIQTFCNDKPDLKEYLEAIRHIGNSASHREKEIADSDLLSGFELLEFCLSKIYNLVPSNIQKSANELTNKYKNKK